MRRRRRIWPKTHVRLRGRYEQIAEWVFGARRAGWAGWVEEWIYHTGDHGHDLVFDQDRVNDLVHHHDRIHDRVPGSSAWW